MALRLHVVDRHTEVERLVRTAEFNGTLGPDRKPVLLYSSQVFGSGKTMFGINATSLLKDPAVAQALINPPADATNIPQDLIDMRGSQKFSQQLVDSYTSARTIYVDLGRGLEKSPARAENRTTFEEALYHAIYSAATDTDVTISELDSKIGSYTPKKLMSLLVKETGHTGKWFFFIDEIGHMEELERHYEEIKSRPVGEAYTALFILLRPFLQRNDTFVFCAGKSAHLTAKSLEESTSPVVLRLLAMSPLLPQHIVEVLRKTETSTGTPLYKALGLQNKNKILQLVAEVLYHFTGGIPRLVLAALESLLRISPIPLTREKLETVMNGKVRSDIVVDTSSFFRPEFMDADATRVYATLLLMSVLGITIQKEWVIGIGPAAGTKFVLDWVSNLCLHLSPAGPDTYRLVFSQFLIDWLQQFPPQDEPRIVLLASLIDQLKGLPVMIDQGRVLEVIIAQALALRLAVAKTFGDIPGLEDTLLHDVAVPKNLGGRFNIQLLPSFQPRTTSGTPKVEQDGTVKSYNPDDWHLFFQNLGTDKWNTVGIARKQNSNGPDLMLPFQVDALANPAQLPASFYHLGIAAKNLQAATATNWDDVQEEIEKGLRTPLKNKNLRGKLKMVLVIASTHLMVEIADAIGHHPCGVYDAGTWYYNKKENALDQKGKALKGWLLKFEVPKGGQLVILSSSGMGMLLGNKTLDTLSDYYSVERAKTKWTNLLLMEHSFSILAHPLDTTTDRKRKREEGRMLVVEFVDDSATVIGKRAAAILPTGTTLNDAKNIISSAFLQQNASMQAHTVVCIEWCGVSVDDATLDNIRHAEIVVAVMQENK